MAAVIRRVEKKALRHPAREREGGEAMVRKSYPPASCAGCSAYRTYLPNSSKPRLQVSAQNLCKYCSSSKYDDKPRGGNLFLAACLVWHRLAVRLFYSGVVYRHSILRETHTPVYGVPLRNSRRWSVQAPMKNGAVPG